MSYRFYFAIIVLRLRVQLLAANVLSLDRNREYINDLINPALCAPSS